ncbi:MAG: DNA mismatch repair protein [Chaenotheca gracillima]|nr:MAG: DNA mismatch repair protein [Chaenotheca gracillima]
MATAEGPPRAHDRHSRKRPFSAWMKRLANIKTPSSDSGSNPQSSTKRHGAQASSKTKKPTQDKGAMNNPYPASTVLHQGTNSNKNGHLSFRSPQPAHSPSMTSLEASRRSATSSIEGGDAPARSNKSTAPTLATNPDTTHSDAANSSKADSTAAGTNVTVGGAMSSHGGGGSTFSSPAHSEHSLTTTLTTIQSTAPSNLMGGVATPQGVPTALSQSHQPNHQQSSSVNTNFSHQFSSSPPPSALPTHLVPQTGGGHPATYSTATANNLLTDNASILTLASSSKRRRRHSLDTDASVRALAPSSLWGGSRESLPLSVLSGNAGDPSTGPTSGGIHQNRPNAAGVAGGERASVYSASGIVPALSSERNSYYAGRQTYTGDGGSVKSGLLGHGRNDSITGSIGGASSPLASPRDRETSASGQAIGRVSRRNSGWGEVSGEPEETEEGDEEEDKEKPSSRGHDHEKFAGS